MKNLVIGDTSQLASYFPPEYEKISSRSIDFRKFEERVFNRVFICFAEQRTFLEGNSNLFQETNITWTIKVAEFFSARSRDVLLYGTSELWNGYEGAIGIGDPFKYYPTPYISSKERMMFHLAERRKRDLTNLIVLHPFNFNSPRRKPGFLFSKIFHSLLNKTPIEIGDTYFYRDLVHPKYVVERSLLAEGDEIVGSGRLIFVNDFIRDLYQGMGLDYKDYVKENFSHNLHIKRGAYYLNSKKNLYPYKKLLEDTLYDLSNPSC